MYGEKSSFRMRKSPKQRDRCWPQIIFVPNQRQAFEWVVEPFFFKGSIQGALSPVLENFRRRKSLPTDYPWVSEDACSRQWNTSNILNQLKSKPAAPNR